MSESRKWSIHKKFERGEYMINTERFMGYAKDEFGELVIKPKEAMAVTLFSDMYLLGVGSSRLGQLADFLGVPSVTGRKWTGGSFMGMFKNEKHKGDAILQKSYTTDFLMKKRAVNQGEIQMFYIEDDHEPIIEPWIWKCVQLEMARRKKYVEEHGTNSYSHNTEQNPFASKIVCGNCNTIFARKGWQSRNGDIRRVGQCSERYKVKGVMGCSNRHVEETTLRKVLVNAWNTLLENREQAVPE